MNLQQIKISFKNNFLNANAKQFFTFITVGVLNTVLTYSFYLLCLNVLHYQVAYFFTYVLGIVLAYLTNLRFVFRAKSSFKKMSLYPFIYIGQYVLAVFLLYIFIDLLRLSEALAPLLVLLSLFPVSYFLNKTVLQAR